MHLLYTYCTLTTHVLYTYNTPTTYLLCALPGHTAAPPRHTDPSPEHTDAHVFLLPINSDGAVAMDFFLF